MARTQHKTVTYNCDVCEKDIEKNDELAIIGKYVPVLIESGNKAKWGMLKVDLCSDCAKKFFKMRATATYVMPTIRQGMNGWLYKEDKDV